MKHTFHVSQEVQQQMADAAAGISMASFLGVTLGDWETIINISVGLVGVIAGVLAAWWHFERIREVRRARRLRERAEQDA